MTKYEQAAHWIDKQKPHLDVPSHLHITINALRNVLFDLPCIYSGYTSQEAINRKYKRSQMTVEHYHSRQRSARSIVYMAMRGAPVDALADEIREACKVHYTTKEENLALIPYQRADDYDWREAYKACNIILVKHDPSIKTYVLDCFSVTAKSKKEAITQFVEITGLSKYAVSKKVILKE
jgi:hypothetical protein